MIPDHTYKVSSSSEMLEIVLTAKLALTSERPGAVFGHAATDAETL